MNQPVLVDGKWTQSNSSISFQVQNPATCETLSDRFPVSDWTDCEASLQSATKAFVAMRDLKQDSLANFIDTIADRIDDRSVEICQMANLETGLPISPRLADVELPRTTNQLRQAANAVRSSEWCQPTIDSSTGIRSMYSGIGPVAVFGPNNFPLAFGSISGGDFASALAAGNPVISKANSSHPNTTRLLAEEVQSAAESCGMPPGIVQMIYRTSHQDGERLVADPRLAAVGYTGSRGAGLKLKRVADETGTPIYLELSSINPMVILPGAIAERGDEIATELAGSCLLGTGQFCTSPGLILLLENEETQKFIDAFTAHIKAAQNGILLSNSVKETLANAIATLVEAGARILCGGEVDDSNGIRFQNTVLRVNGETFLGKAEKFQTEAFGNASLIVTVQSIDQAADVIRKLEGNLTGAIYSSSSNNDEGEYGVIEPELRHRVGRLLNDKMPTGVAVSSAMNHGGPFPATGHPAFSAVGIPQSIFRFSMLQCYDNVRQHRLPKLLQDENPGGFNRLVDGVWTKEPLSICSS